MKRLIASMAVAGLVIAGVVAGERDAGAGPVALLGTNISEIANHVGSPLKFQIPQAAAVGVGENLWRPEERGAMPGAFQAPWKFQDHGFDPSFRTSYWREGYGFINTTDAPWNVGWAGYYGLGPAIFNSGMALMPQRASKTSLPDWSSLSDDDSSDEHGQSSVSIAI